MPTLSPAMLTIFGVGLNPLEPKRVTSSTESPERTSRVRASLPVASDFGAFTTPIWPRVAKSGITKETPAIWYRERN